MYFDITVARREAASYRIVFISTFYPVYSESCEFSLRFLCSGHCIEQSIEHKIIADSAKQVRLRMRNSLFY